MALSSPNPADPFPGLYDQLRELAAQHFARQPAGHTLQPTALVNEAYLKFAHAAAAPVGDRAHFFALASRIMRQVLVDHARARRSSKRNHGGGDRVTLSEVGAEGPAREVDVVALEEALVELAQLSQQKAKLIELRFFGGLDEVEAAAALGISRSSAARQWRMARAWLAQRLMPGDA